MGDGEKHLLAIVELGGYPNFVPLYEKSGYQVTVVNSQRKARNFLKKYQPDVVVCEYNFQSDFRDRTSNIETLLAVLQKYPQVRLIVFYLPEHEHKLNQVRERFTIFEAISFPIDENILVSSINQDG
jgi:CheY-like chemotaxis protein